MCTTKSNHEHNTKYLMYDMYEATFQQNTEVRHTVLFRSFLMFRLVDFVVVALYVCYLVGTIALWFFDGW